VLAPRTGSGTRGCEEGDVVGMVGAEDGAAHGGLDPFGAPNAAVLESEPHATKDVPSNGNVAIITESHGMPDVIGAVGLRN
jgi:hypothetical protein